MKRLSTLIAILLIAIIYQFIIIKNLQNSLNINNFIANEQFLLEKANLF